MAGVGEVSAVVGLAAVATQLSKAVIDVASKYKAAAAQIESFGNEVRVLGGIISQLSRLLNKNAYKSNDAGLESVICSVLDQCKALFGELETYKENLYGSLESPRRASFRARAQWVFQATELQYLRARVDSMKINMLLMMTLQMSQNKERKSADPGPSLEDDQIESLSFQSDTCVKRLQILEESLVALLAEDVPAMYRLSIGSLDISHAARSMRNSILSFYGRESYYAKILAPRETSFYLAQESQFDLSRESQVIEDYLNLDLTEKTSSSELYSSRSKTVEISADPSVLNTQDTMSALDVKWTGRIKDGEASEHIRNIRQNLNNIPSPQVFSSLDDERSATSTQSLPSKDQLPHPSQVESLTSSRLALDAPCSTVLPTALSKYHIDADPKLYSLFMIYEDRERCLEMDEKPLEISKRLINEGKKPLLMLRRNPAPF
ncbi:MAG: hypothetical protein Q9167_006288 [Letrouitia subvulpina]